MNHDRLVNLVEYELKLRGLTEIFKYTNYPEGEIDLYAFKYDKYVLLFEMKGTDNIRNYNKSIKQTNRAERHYFDKEYRVFKFYVTWRNGKPYIEWIKQRRKIKW